LVLDFIGFNEYDQWSWWIVSILELLLLSNKNYSDFPFTPFGSPRFHDIHHSTFKDNYGAIQLLDKIHGTWKDPITIKKQ
jgi:sterol desaturase/sphingolipid hydroxylase (fatty acid hydroxylase superfamily)